MNQRSPAPESAMFGVPGVGHSKPALLSPGWFRLHAVYSVFLRVFAEAIDIEAVHALKKTNCNDS